MKYAVIRRNGLGDFISATVPLCNYIRMRDKEAQLILFMSPQNIRLVKYFFDDVSCNVIRSGNKYFEAVKTALICRWMRPDVGIAPVPAYNKLNALFLRTLGCDKVYGVNTGEGIEKLLLTHISNVNRENHVALQTIQALNSDIRSIDPSWYPVMNQERIKLYQFGQKGKARLIVEVSNHRPTSQLANEKLANILNDLSKRIDFTVVITLRPGYEETAKKIVRSVANAE